MTTKTIICAAILSAAVPGWAWSADFKVVRTLQLQASSSTIWNQIGDFCDIDDWHPTIQSCRVRVIEGRLHRVLITTDGEEVTEQRIAEEPGLSYTYKITEAPMPFENFVATLSVEPIEGVLISWSANFSSDDPTMEAAVVEMIEAGLAAIADIHEAN